jgi:hypothetical protein
MTLARTSARAQDTDKERKKYRDGKEVCGCQSRKDAKTSDADSDNRANNEGVRRAHCDDGPDVTLNLARYKPMTSRPTCYRQRSR